MRSKKFQFQRILHKVTLPSSMLMQLSAEDYKRMTLACVWLQQHLKTTCASKVQSRHISLGARHKIWQLVQQIVYSDETLGRSEG